MADIIDIIMSETITKNTTEYTDVIDLKMYNTDNWTFAMFSNMTGNTASVTITPQYSFNGKDDWVDGTAFITTQDPGAGGNQQWVAITMLATRWVRFSIAEVADTVDAVVSLSMSIV